jgi:hypothetical protein
MMKDPKGRAPQDVDQVRRRLLQGIMGAGTVLAGAQALGAPLRFLQPMQVDNPLAAYPNRDWEKAYRDIFRSDSSFVFLCAPNDTHNCLLRGHVKNGVVTRIAPTYGYGKAEDLYGNKASARWDPRTCQKGVALVRRIYGDRRVKAPMVRRGFKAWVDAGFPRGPDGKPDVKYFQRGKAGMRPTTWRPRRWTTLPAPIPGMPAPRNSWSRDMTRPWWKPWKAPARRPSKCAVAWPFWAPRAFLDCTGLPT